MASGSRAAGRHRPALRWGGGLVAGLLALGGLATAAGAQTPPAPGGPAAPAAPAPPADNVFPVPAPYEVHFSDDFHACRDGCSRRHKGNDVLADEGAPLVAVESGVIAKVQSTDTGLGGLTVWLRGDSGVAYYYAHNSENLVTEGERVTRGQTIARVGHTGNARDTASHVHFQINVCGDLTSDEPCTINPFPHLTAWAQTMAGGGADGVAWYDPASAWWGLRTETGAELSAVPFGPAGALDVLPLAGDWDGDGQDSVGLYQRSDATFHLRDDEGNDMTPVAFGTPGRTDVWPIAGDFDGDGRDTIGLYQQSDATFVVLVDGGVRSAPLAVGTAWRSDALPVVGDWNGDGKDSVGVYQQADTTLMLVDDNGVPIDPATVTTPSTRPDGTMAFDAYPIAGDWDGDGRDSVGVMWRTADRFDLPVPTATDPAATRTVTADGVEAPAALPVAGDWNGTNLVTLDELHQIFGPLPDEAKVVEGLPALNVAMLRAGITTPARKAAFLATLRNESGFRYDAVEAGSDKRYRGRGFIQITGDFNYRAAGDYLGIDLAGQPDLAINPLVSPAVAAWYWTVARNINMAADQLDMAAVGIAIGYAPSTKRDMMRCADFTAALRYYSGGTVPDSVNCARTPESRRLAFATAVPIVTRGPVVGIPAPQQPGTVTLDTTAIPPGWTPPDGGTPVPSEPSPPPAPPAPPATDPAPPATDPPATDPPATDPPATDPPATDPPGTDPPPATDPSVPPTDPTTTGTTAAPSSTTTTGTSTTSSSDPTTTTTTSVVPDSTTSTTLFDSQYQSG